MRPEELPRPISGPGEWMSRTLQARAEKVAECIAHGPVEFETVKPPGYNAAQTRCKRCKVLKKFHVVEK